MLDVRNNATLLNALKCYQCSKLLSVLPVYYSSGTGNICGRCVDVLESPIKNGDAQRAVAYEAVAQFLLFPCSNYQHGCGVKLNCEQIKQHENKCQFSLFPCPFNQAFGEHAMKCDWTGIGRNFTDHLHRDHKDDLQTDLTNFQLNVNFTYVRMVLMVIYNVTFLVITKFIKTTNKFYCAVICCENSIDHRLFSYQLELGRENDYFLTLHKPETELFTNVQEIINKEENMIVTDVSDLRMLIGDPSGLMFYKICIIKKPNNNTSLIKSSTSFEDSESKIDIQYNLKSAYADTLLDEVECPVCNEYMIPPIFICPMGHSICSSCKAKIRICPSCRSQIQDTRNYTLEKLTTVFEYPCKNQGSGCNLRLKLEEIELHQLHCLYGFQECPWKPFNWCDDEKIVDLIEHCRNKHTDNIIKTNNEYLLKTDIKPWLRAVITPEKEFFIICFDGTEQFNINFIHVINRGINKTKSTYKYKLEFCDKTGDNLEFTISKLCQIIHPFDRSSAMKNCLSIPKEMIEPFVVKNPDRTVTVKFHIEKIK